LPPAWRENPLSRAAAGWLTTSARRAPA